MADLNDNEAAQSVKIIGASTAGLETTPVAATTLGALHSNLRDNSGLELGTTGNPLKIDPTGTTNQPVVSKGTNPSSTETTVPITGIDASNSSSSVLLADATFTGAWVNVSRYSILSVLVTSDQVSATDGLKLEYSTDGLNVDDSDSYTIPANEGQQISAPLTAAFYRIRYTNGGVSQTSFRLQAKLHATNIKPSSHKLGNLVTNESDAELVKAGLMLQSGTNNVNVNLGQQANASSVPVSLSTEQSITLSTIATNTANTTSVSGTLSALNAALTVSTINVKSVRVTVTGTWASQLTMEGEISTGVWVSAFGSYSAYTVPGYQAGINLNGTVLVNTAGFSQFRVRFSSYSSGTANVTINTSTVDLVNMVAQTGAWLTSKRDGLYPTYSATVTGLVVANTPTDIFTINSTTINPLTKITKIIISGTQTTATNRDVLIIKRSALNTGGTSSVITGVPHSGLSSAATAVVRSYTANPTSLGTAVGTLRSTKLMVATATTVTQQYVFDFGDLTGESVLLYGSAQLLAVNLNGVTWAGNSINVTIEWIEGLF